MRLGVSLVKTPIYPCFGVGFDRFLPTFYAGFEGSCCQKMADETCDIFGFKPRATSYFDQQLCTGHLSKNGR